MIESRFYIGENETAGAEKKIPQRNILKRRFGAKLSANILETCKEKSATPKKLVRVKRTTSSSKSKENTNLSPSPDRSTSNGIVVFSPGPVGLQLEPNQLNYTKGCKIVRFVDGGPKNPGQARKSGKLKPGDLVTKVEANGVVGSSYDDIVEILKDTCATRTVTFQSVWNSPNLQSRTKSGVIRQIKPPETPERPLTPNAHNLSSAKRKKSTQKETFLELETILPPPFLLGSSHKLNRKDEIDEVGHDAKFDITLIQSPSHAALLPHVRTPLSYAVRSPHVRTPPSYAALLPGASNTLQYLPKQRGDNNGNPFFVDLGDRFALAPVLPRIPSVSVSNGSKHHAAGGTYANGQILSFRGNPSIDTANQTKRSSLFSPSSVRRLSRVENRGGDIASSIMSRVFQRLCMNEVPVVAHPSESSSLDSSMTGKRDSSTLTNVDDSNATRSYRLVPSAKVASGEAQDINYMKAQVLQELRYMQIAKDVEDIASQEVERTIEKNKEENVLVKLQLGGRLQDAKVQYAAAEKELRDLCKRQESTILDLEEKNRNLEERLINSRGGVSVENIHLSTVQETLHRTMGKLESKRKEAEELENENGLFQERLSFLEGELETKRENEKSLIVELEMSKTMTKELERRLVLVETSSAESVKALQDNLVVREEELKISQTLAAKLKEEAANLLNHMNCLETGVKALQTENEELRWELAKTKKDLEESKNEVATIHERLLQNLENGACVDAGLGYDEKVVANTDNPLDFTEKAHDETTWDRAFRCALVVFTIRETIFATRYSDWILKMDALNDTLWVTLEKLQERVRRDEDELLKRNRHIITLKELADEMATSVKSGEEHRTQELDENLKHWVRVGVYIDPHSVNTHHLISTLRRNSEVLQFALSRMERNLVSCTSKFEQTINLCQSDLQIALDSENALKSTLDATMEKLSRTSTKLKKMEEKESENEAYLRDSEESLSQAVHIIHKLEADIAEKDRKLEYAESQINAIKEKEEVLSSEQMALCEKILGLEERLTESTEHICKLRRTCNSVESQKVALEMKLQTMMHLSSGMKALVLEKEESHQKVRTLRDQLKACREEIEVAYATNSLLESDLMDLLDKSEEQRRCELLTKEELCLELFREKESRRVLEQQHLETLQLSEVFKQRASALQVAFLASLGIDDAKSQSLLNENTNLARLVEEKTKDIEVLEHEVSKSQKQIDALRGARESLRGEILQLETRLGVETQGLQSEIEAVSIALSASKTQHLLTSENLRKAQYALAEVWAQRDSLQSEIAGALEREEVHTKDVQSAVQEVSLLRSMLRKAQFSYCAALAALEGLDRLSSRSAEDALQKESQIASLADQICKIEDELRCIEDNYELENCWLLKTIDDHRRTICSLVAASMAEHFRSRKAVARVWDNKSHMLEIAAKLDFERSELLNFEDSIHENEDLEKRLRVLENDCNSKSKEICSLKSCIAVEREKVFSSRKVFETERKQLLTTLIEMAQEISTLKGFIEDIQEDQITEFERTKIIIEDLRCERDSISRELKQAKKDTHSERQRNLTCRKEFDNLRALFHEIDSENEGKAARINQLEKEIAELTETSKASQKNSNQWQSEAISLDSQVEAMTKKYHKSVDEITGLHEVNESLLSRLRTSEDTISFLRIQQKSNESDLESYEIIVSKMKEESEKALRERDEAMAQVCEIQNTIAKAENKLSYLTRERDLLLSKRCIAEAALAGLHRHVEQGIRSLRDVAAEENTDLRAEVVNCNGNQSMMGARLLSLVVEHRTRMGIAGAFRKWSCANNAIKATSKLHRTSNELSHQLHCTREKLLALKSHIKANSIQVKESKPRFRVVLKPLTDQQRMIDPREKMNL